ncbi:unnamed protein product [Coregonus sp. 'balchen']|nr:unnamed protein product [Coregonus sp. 'balchen']
MFRTKRTGLVRRLWRSRAPVEGEGEADTRTHGSGGCCMGKSTKVAGKTSVGTEAELKALTHSILKKIKDKQLEGLLQAVESKGGARSPCLLLPSKVDTKLESPPPPYSRYPMDLLKPPDSLDSGPSSTETGGTTYSAPVGLSGMHPSPVFLPG